MSARVYSAKVRVPRVQSAMPKMVTTRSTRPQSSIPSLPEEEVLGTEFLIHSGREKPPTEEGSRSVTVEEQVEDTHPETQSSQCSPDVIEKLSEE